MVQTPTAPTAKLSKVESTKKNSNYLREPLATELEQDTNFFSEDAIQILKFHGSYQQDNRDNRVKGQEKDYQMMLRTRTPGGFVPPQLYLTLDRLSDEYGNGTLRATTRQAYQLHGVVKSNLRTVMGTIIKNLGSTLAACGDVNRNIMSPPAPYKNRPEYDFAWEYANNITNLLSPQTGAYYEIWLDGEKVVTAEEKPEIIAARKRNDRGTNSDDEVEPIYGNTYMPRKFKIAVTVPGDNSIDIYSQDLGLVVITNNKGELEGFNVFAGGGLGRTHNKEETFPRIADEIGYVDQAKVYDLVKAIVATQRDYGDRTNRRHARMKYLIEDWGVEKFKEKVESYLGEKIADFRTIPTFKYYDFLGWNQQGDGKLFLGISVQNGRIKDEGNFKLKTALREIISKYNLPTRLTPHQNVIIYDIETSQKGEIQEILDRCQVNADPYKIDPLERQSMACPALPTCGLAITESERIIPSFIERIRAILNKIGLEDESFVIRMTGCPNGCARPYLAELGFVGSFTESYQVWLGGSPDQTRLAKAYTERMHANDLEKFLEPILMFFKTTRENGESFGDFCDRIGFEAIRNFTATYEFIPEEKVKTQGESKVRHRVTVRDEIYDRLKEVSGKTGKSLVELASLAIEKYLAELE
jgi:sulfite reductase (ferredoxin)